MRRAHFTGRAQINFGLYGAPGDLQPGSIAAMAAEGVIGFKMFTTAMPAGRDDEFAGLSFAGEADQFEAMQRVAETGLPLVVHAESADMIARGEAAAIGRDRSRASTHEAARPALAEAVAVAKLLEMNIRAGARLHIAHVTSAATVAVLRRYRGTSDFSAETCPHYLVRSSEEVDRIGVYGKVNPPIRGKADQEALWAAIADGTICHVTTDHSSFSAEEKRAAEGDFLDAPPGIPGAEMLVPVVLDAVGRGLVSLDKAVALLSANAAARFNLAAKGRIAAGSDADLVLVDLAGTTVIDIERLHTHAPNNAQLFAGARFAGRVVRTIVAGQSVATEGRISTVGPIGRYVAGPNFRHEGRTAA
jgi:dihydropyrimidinase/allantoinase